MADIYRLTLELSSDWSTVEILLATPQADFRLSEAFSYEDLKSTWRLKRIDLTLNSIALGRFQAKTGQSIVSVELECPYRSVMLRTRKGSLGELKISSNYGDSVLNNSGGSELNEQIFELKVRAPRLGDTKISSPLLLPENDQKLYETVRGLGDDEGISDLSR